MANNNYPQITSVTSEALQAQIRNLLPSQEGFGTDLMAQNVIVPVIDLTGAAEGSTTGVNLQTALAFGSQTSFSASNSTDVIANTAGFWRITAGITIVNHPSIIMSATLQGSDGLSTKTLWQGNLGFSSTAKYATNFNLDLIVFLDSGESVSAISNSANVQFAGSARQIANISGGLVNPSGFNPQ